MFLLDGIEIHCLGRNFQVGKLYSIYKYQLVEEEQTDKTTCPLQNDNKKCHNFTSNAADSNLSILEMNNNLKLSILTGLVEPEGASKHMLNILLPQEVGSENIPSTSTNEVEIALYFQCITSIESVDTEIQHEAPFDDKATHVVTQVHYGHEGLFVAKVDESQRKEVIDGIVSAIDKCTNYDKHVLSCTFHGSFSLQNEIKTIQDAVAFCNNIKACTVDAHIAHVSSPIKATLSQLQIKQPMQYVQIDSDVTQKLESRLKKFGVDLAQCSDQSSKFQGINKKLSQAKELLCRNRNRLKKELASALPKVKAGDESIETLHEVFTQQDSYCFNKKFPEWIKHIKTEIIKFEEFTAKINKGMYACTHVLSPAQLMVLRL